MRKRSPKPRRRSRASAARIAGRRGVPVACALLVIGACSTSLAIALLSVVARARDEPSGERAARWVSPGRIVALDERATDRDERDRAERARRGRRAARRPLPRLPGARVLVAPSDSGAGRRRFSRGGA